jgi:Flp pilus assembly protein TadD
LQELAPRESNNPAFHVHYGVAAYLQKKHGEAEAAWGKALDLRPECAEAHYCLGILLGDRQKLGAAEAAYRKAIAFRPEFAKAYTNLASTLLRQGKYREAEAACRKAHDLRPDLLEAYVNLGNALLGQGKYGAAEAAFRKAVDLKPDDALAHRNLGLALIGQARFDEAAASLRKAGDLSPATAPLREQARQEQRQCQRFVALGARLPAILRGTEKPANAAEQLELAQLCFVQKHHAAAARFARDAFAADPKLAQLLPAGLRYLAACAGALAGCGHGKDADKLDDEERALWRRQALDWLRQDLTWWGKALDNGDA